MLLGRTREELGGSEYLKVFHKMVRGTPPWIDLRMERAAHRCCFKAIEKGILKSAHDVSDGGLAVALVESCLGGGDAPIGVKIELRQMMRVDALLFGESQSRIVVSVEEKNLSLLKELASKEGIPLQVIGVVGGSRFVIHPMIRLGVDELQSIWANAFERQLT